MPVKTILCLLMFIMACSKPEVDTLKPEILKSDNVKIKISPSAKTLRTCDLLELSIEVTYPREFKMKLPDSKADFGDFMVYQINQNSPESVNEKKNRLYQIIILEPGLPANHQLSSLNFTFWDNKDKEFHISSEPITFEVRSSIDPQKNKEIEDIITETDKPGHTVTIVGSSALFLTLFYFIFICKPEEELNTDPLLEEFKNFQELKKLEKKELLKKLSKSAGSVLKLKYNLDSSVANSDALLKELQNKSDSEKIISRLNELFNEYNKLRFSSNNLNAHDLLSLHNSFESLLKEILK